MAEHTITRMSKSWGSRLRLLLCATVFLPSAVLIIVLVRMAPPLPRRNTVPGHFMFSIPRDGGFNNQLITVYEGIRCAQRHNHTLVLPLLYLNARYDINSRGDGPYPFTDFFNISALSNIVSVTTPADLERLGGPRCNGRVLFVNSKNHRSRYPRLLQHQYRWYFSIVPKHSPSLVGPDGPALRTAASCIDDSVCGIPSFEKADEFGVYSDYSRDV